MSEALQYWPISASRSTRPGRQLDRKPAYSGWMMRAPPPPPVRAPGYASAAWCLGFAGVSVWLVAGMVGQPGGSGLVIVSVLALALKLAGAAAARAAPWGGPGDPDPVGPAVHLMLPGGPGSR